MAVVDLRQHSLAFVGCRGPTLAVVGLHGLHWHAWPALACVACIGMRGLHWHAWPALACVACIGMRGLRWQS